VDKPASNGARPFLKWVGGKSRLLPRLIAELPRYRTYHEPMLGGGALFFALRPKRAVLSDTNRELIDTFRAVQTSVGHVVTLLKEYRYERDYYYEVREQDPNKLDLYESAARTIYLNKTGFNGLYRVNQRGKFNVPFGRYTNPTICDEPNLRACAAALRGVDLRCGAFHEVRPRKGDLVYFDPPFLPPDDAKAFTSYTAEGFGGADHYHLAGFFRELKARGCHVMLSNSDTTLARRLYRGYPTERVQVGRTVGCKDRGDAPELIVRSFPVSRRGRRRQAYH